jgi:alanyl-tRNA synthetase
MALFGEKYGDSVRVVTIDPDYSIELCGGTHVGYTGSLGYFKIVSESAVAAGVRRIEAVCGKAAQSYIGQTFRTLQSVKEQLKNPKDLTKAVEQQMEENSHLKKSMEALSEQVRKYLLAELLEGKELNNDCIFIGKVIEVNEADTLKKLCHDMKEKHARHIVVLGAVIQNKPFIAIGIDNETATARNWDAGKIIKETISPIIKGGGGGQKTLASAGGQDATRLKEAIDTVRTLVAGK